MFVRELTIFWVSEGRKGMLRSAGLSRVKLFTLTSMSPAGSFKTAVTNWPSQIMIRDKHTGLLWFSGLKETCPCMRTVDSIGTSDRGARGEGWSELEPLCTVN